MVDYSIIHMTMTFETKCFILLYLCVKAFRLLGIEVQYKIHFTNRATRYITSFLKQI